MEPDLAPEEIRRAQFRTVLRGLDAAEVTQYLEKLAGEVETLIEQRDRLASRLGEYADRDLKTEFDDVGREVAAVLQSAREAAESMRERASLDAARWRAESIGEAETLLSDARNDAEALRGDAWATGSELINQTHAEIRQMRQDAERDLLTVMGEAEREAHRLTSAARREAEDILRAATMDAEKTAAQATKRHDEMIEQAHRAAESAQERTRALEERREELLEELEHARATLNRLEGTLDERREGLNIVAEPSTSVRIVTPTPRHEPEAPPPRTTWQPGETVRIIQTGQRDQSDLEPLAAEVAADVERIKQREAEPEPEPQPSPKSRSLRRPSRCPRPRRLSNRNLRSKLRQLSRQRPSRSPTISVPYLPHCAAATQASDRLLPLRSSSLPKSCRQRIRRPRPQPTSSCPRPSCRVGWTRGTFACSRSPIAPSEA